LDAYLREQQSCQISFRSDLKRRSFRLFEEEEEKKEQDDQQQQQQQDK